MYVVHVLANANPICHLTNQSICERTNNLSKDKSFVEGQISWTCPMQANKPEMAVSYIHFCIIRGLSPLLQQRLCHSHATAQIYYFPLN